MSQNDDDTLLDVVRSLGDLGDRQEKVSVHDIREVLGERSIGPFLTIPALIELTPLGGVPGLPSLIALMIAIVAVQILVGREHLWLPNVLERRTLKGKNLKSGMDWLERPARWADRAIQPRLAWVTGKAGRRFVAMLCILLCLTVPPLEFLPFASGVPMAAIALMGLGLMGRDGLLIAGAAVAAVVGLVALWMTVGAVSASVL